MHKYVFGPVASSRLGRSLGLDLLGRKICTFDCLYCEVGPTRKHTTSRAPYVPASAILGELAAWRKAHPSAPDFVTLGGSGEPCLNTDMAAILSGAKEIVDADLAVLTNSSLLHLPEVRQDLASADAVLPSLDTLVPAEYLRLNRPAPDLDPDQADMGLTRMVRALQDFRSGYAGRLYLEVLLVAGVNDSEENLALLSNFVSDLKPERVDVVTMTRPGAHEGARPVDSQSMARWREALNAHAPEAARPGGPEAATLRNAPEPMPDAADLEATLHASLSRRPQTAAQLAQALAVPLADVQKALASLEKHGHIIPEKVQGPGQAVFYRGKAG